MRINYDEIEFIRNSKSLIISLLRYHHITPVVPGTNSAI